MDDEQKSTFLFIGGIIPLWIMFLFGLLIWWALMSSLFKQGTYLSAIIVAYSLPIVYSLAAGVAATRHGHYIKLLHFISFFLLSIIFFLVFILSEGFIEIDYGAWLSLSFISSVMAIMQYPKAGLQNYQLYKTPLFISGVIFMPLFVYFAALLPNVPPPPSIDKAILFPLGMVGFWGSAAWLASRKTQGDYAPNLEIKPLMPFRPDYILPGGVLYVKGVILMGVGLMILIHPQFGMPKWNWWGFVLAFWGIITLIPLRGMYKMIKGRRLRMLGKGGWGFKEELSKDLILFIGLNILLYGFVNAFFGTIPFLELGFKPEYNAFFSKNLATGLFSLITFVLSFVILIPLRGYYKTTLLEGIENARQMLTKQLLLYGGTLLLLISYIHLLYLPPIRALGIMWIYPISNPLGIVVGVGLFLAGSVLILVFRPIALKNEFEATIETMVGGIADAQEGVRNWVMKNRIEILVSMPEAQRDEHVKLMIRGLNKLPKEKKKIMVNTQMEILASSKSETRRLMMSSMDKAMFEGD